MLLINRWFNAVKKTHQRCYSLCHTD